VSFIDRSSWGVLLAAGHAGDINLIVILICVLFLLAGLYLLVTTGNYIAAAVAVVLAIVVAVFFA
jgi:hypothetical protein